MKETSELKDFMSNTVQAFTRNERKIEILTCGKPWLTPEQTKQLSFELYRLACEIEKNEQ